MSSDQINELRGITDANGSVMKKPEDLIRKGLEKAFPTITQEEKNLAVQKIEAHDDGKIKIGNTEITVGEMEFAVASSIQYITSETDPQNEFYSWIDDGVKIIHDMNHDGATQAEFEQRQEFLGDLDQRETEIKTCIVLYRHASMGTGRLAVQAREKMEFLQTKWAKLMEIRAAIKNSTPNRADEERKITEEDRNRMMLYVWALNMMKDGRDVPSRIKAKLGMNYGITFDYSISEKLIQKINNDEVLTKKQAIDRINVLRGRKSVVENSAVETQRQSFNSNTFYLLREQELRQRA